MSTKKLPALSEEELINLFENAARDQGKAVFDFDVSAANRAYRSRDAAYNELASRGVDAPLKVAHLLDHHEPAMRLYTATHLLGILPDRARPVLEDIAKHGTRAFAGTAGMALDIFDKKF